jgi:glycosyltransferase involved in cell wall biosynthesis
MNQPLISIITICKNQPDIDVTCQSVVSQTFRDFEWVVVDGASTDGVTLQILGRYRDSISCFISESDHGLYNAMNHGIQVAQGRYLVFMNGGDLFHDAGVLERIAPYLLRGYNLVYGDAKLIHADGRSSIRRYPDFLFPRYFIGDCLCHQATYIAKELFARYGYYDEAYRIVSDWEKWIVFFKNKITYLHVDTPCATHHLTGVGALLDETHLKEREAGLQRHFTVQEIQRYKRWEQRRYVKIVRWLGFPLLEIKRKATRGKITVRLFKYLPLVEKRYEGSRITYRYFDVNKGCARRTTVRSNAGNGT